MPLQYSGLLKLSEECGELIQVAMKRVAFDGEGDIHWDGSNMKERLEEEIADVMAASAVVQELIGLDYKRIEERTLNKVNLFMYWHKGGTEIALPNIKDHIGSIILEGIPRADGYCTSCDRWTCYIRCPKCQEPVIYRPN